MMVRYHWQGNIRELENVIERIVVTVTQQTNELSVEHLPDFIRAKMFLPESSHMRKAVEDFESYLLRDAYQECGSWVMAARKLGINTATAYRKAGRYGLLK